MCSSYLVNVLLPFQNIENQGGGSVGKPSDRDFPTAGLMAGGDIVWLPAVMAEKKRCESAFGLFGYSTNREVFPLSPCFQIS